MLRITHTKLSRRTVIICFTILAAAVGGAYAYEAYLHKTAVTPPQDVVSAPLPPSGATSVQTSKTTQQRSVAPTHPRQLTIARLNIKTDIITVGLTADGAMDAPVNAWDTGWYNQSSSPGTRSGALLIDGHVNNALGTPGVFFRIDTLQAGDIIEVERGDGIVFTYSVVIVEQKKIEDVDMAKMMQSITPGIQGLNLITCAGNYNPQRQTFDDRVLVYAQQVE